MTTQIEDLVGLTEIAERCNVSKNVASGWTRKHTFPEIKHKLAMGPMWDWKEVQAYLFPTPKVEVRILKGDAFAYAPKSPCDGCGSEDVRIEGDGELKITATSAWVEYVLHCNVCTREFDRELELKKEEA
jgi:hypothetical protein